MHFAKFTSKSKILLQQFWYIQHEVLIWVKVLNETSDSNFVIQIINWLKETLRALPASVYLNLDNATKN